MEKVIQIFMKDTDEFLESIQDNEIINNYIEKYSVIDDEGCKKFLVVEDTLGFEWDTYCVKEDADFIYQVYPIKEDTPDKTLFVKVKAINNDSELEPIIHEFMAYLLSAHYQSKNR